MLAQAPASSAGSDVMASDRTRVLRHACLAWIVALLMPVVAPAQTAYLLWQEPPSLMSVDLSTLQTTTRAIPAAGRLPYVTPDGRFMVWVNAPFLRSGEAEYPLIIFDLATNQITTLPGPFAPALVGHPRRSEVYLRDATGTVALSPSGVRRFRDFPCEFLFGATIAADGSRVSFNCSATPGFVFDTDSGATLMDLPSGAPWVALSHDGLSLFADGLRVSAQGIVSVLRRFDVATGALVVDREFPLGTPPRHEIDPRTGWLYPFGSRGIAEPGVGVVLDPATLLDGPQVTAGETWAFDRQSSATIVAQPVNFGSPASCDVYVTGLATAISATGLPACPAGIVFAPLPDVPSPLTATVQGAAVQLTWMGGPSQTAATRYVLEVGSAPGLADLIVGLDLGLQTSFAAAGVPPGTYYVRVRAGNYTGLSAPSNEVVVTVP